MFSYRPPKGSCWSHVIRPNNTLKAIQKTHAFFDAYFEPVETENLTFILDPYLDVENHLLGIKEKALQLFGPHGGGGSMVWTLAPGNYQRVMNLVLQSHLPPKLPGDPVRMSFTCALKWKNSILPNIEWPEELLKPENEKWQRSLFMVDLSIGGRISFIMGITIPISSQEPASYEFLGRFSAAAPFKMSPKHFKVVIPIGGKGRWVSRKPDAEVLRRLQEVIGIMRMR